MEYVVDYAETAVGKRSLKMYLGREGPDVPFAGVFEAAQRRIDSCKVGQRAEATHGGCFCELL